MAFSCNLQKLVVEEHLYFGLIVIAMSVIRQAGVLVRAMSIIRQAGVLVIGSSTAVFILCLHTLTTKQALI